MKKNLKDALKTTRVYEYQVGEFTTETRAHAREILQGLRSLNDNDTRIVQTMIQQKVVR